jgi:hypothetical protein
MFKLVLLGGIIYYLYTNFWRESSLSGKSSRFLNSKPTPKPDDQVEDANFTELK